MSNPGQLNLALIDGRGKKKKRVPLGIPSRPGVNIGSTSARPLPVQPSLPDPHADVLYPPKPPEVFVQADVEIVEGESPERPLKRRKASGKKKGTFQDKVVDALCRLEETEEASVLGRLTDDKIAGEAVSQICKGLITMSECGRRFSFTRKELASVKDERDMAETNWKSAMEAIVAKHEDEMAEELEEKTKVESRVSSLEAELRVQGLLAEEFRAKAESAISAMEEKENALREARRDAQVNIDRIRESLREQHFEEFLQSERYQRLVIDFFFDGFNLAKSNISKLHPELDLSSVKPRRSFYEAYHPEALYESEVEDEAEDEVEVEEVREDRVQDAGPSEQGPCIGPSS